jgi:hypothetical protein
VGAVKFCCYELYIKSRVPRFKVGKVSDTLKAPEKVKNVGSLNAAISQIEKASFKK